MNLFLFLLFDFYSCFCWWWAATTAPSLLIRYARMAASSPSGVTYSRAHDVASARKVDGALIYILLLHEGAAESKLKRPNRQGGTFQKKSDLASSTAQILRIYIFLN